MTMAMQTRKIVLGNTRVSRRSVPVESKGSESTDEQQHPSQNDSPITSCRRRSTRRSIAPSRYTDEEESDLPQDVKTKRTFRAPNQQLIDQCTSIVETKINKIHKQVYETKIPRRSKRRMLEQSKSSYDDRPKTSFVGHYMNDSTRTIAIQPEAQKPGPGQASIAAARRRNMASLNKAVADRAKQTARFEIMRQQIQAEIPFELREERDVLKRKLQETEREIIDLEKHVKDLQEKFLAERTEVLAEVELEITKFVTDILYDWSSDEVEEFINDSSEFSFDMNSPSKVSDFEADIFNPEIQTEIQVEE